nr:phage terminase small subunit P27 family [Holtiella tumoricola]
MKGNSDLVYEPPKHLSNKEKSLYTFLVEELRASGILNNLDVTMLEATVDSIVKMQEANKLIKKHGLVIEKSDGSLQRNPASTIYKDYNAIFNKCCMELGLSPSARARLSVINANTKKNNEDPLLKILRDKKLNRSDVG